MSENVSVKTLDTFNFYKRLWDIDLSLRFSLAAIEKHEQAVQPRIESIKQELTASLGAAGLTEITEAVKCGAVDEVVRALNHGEPSKRLLLNLSLVMLCTELEVFITHLIDVVLASQPKLLLSTAGEKQLTASDIVNSTDYEEVVAKLRNKVADEVTRSAPDKMFLHYLGKRFGVVTEDELTPTTPSITGEVPPVLSGWDMRAINNVFRARHDIVHRATLPVVECAYIDRVCCYFGYIELLLSRNTRRKYTVPMKAIDYGMLAGFGRLYGIEFDANRESRDNLVSE